MAAFPHRNEGPYRVERLDTPDGPQWRLSGPGLEGTKSYPWEEFRDKLQEMAELMNFAWHQATRGQFGPNPKLPQAHDPG